VAVAGNDVASRKGRRLVQCARRRPVNAPGAFPMDRYPGPVTTAAPPAAPGAPVPPTSGPGLFISFEGGDGVGKTTQIRILADLLTAADVDHVLTREPGGTGLGLEIRRLLLHGGYVAPRAEALLYAADRAHHIATRVRPALERGAVVLADRYLDSSVAYQGAARSLGPQEVRDLSLWATEGLLPDLTILLDGDPDLAEQSLFMPDNPLTAREMDICRAALKASSITDIAAQVGLSAGTVRNHLSAIIAKTQARNHHDAVYLAQENGWL